MMVGTELPRALRQLLETFVQHALGSSRIRSSTLRRVGAGHAADSGKNF
jgi:hypothetical protein